MMDKTHLIGIGGTGLSAIARVLLERGESVSGSDRQDSQLIRNLREDGARISIGHSAENVRDADLVIRSSAILDDNVEVKTARSSGIPVLKRSEYITRLLGDKFTIAVAGTHGKTTTTSMLAWVMTELDQKPSYIIGGVPKNLGTNGRSGEGPVFVIEADEYDNMFLGLSPTIAVVTNVEYDHPDFFPTRQDFHGAFTEFVQRLTPDGSLIACADDPGASSLMAEVEDTGRLVISYGLDHSSNANLDYSGRNLVTREGEGYSFDVYHGETCIAHSRLNVPGRHNVLNALATLSVVDLAALPVNEASAALSEFRGIERRFDILGEARGVLVVDDYAHHPTEIRATLSAVRKRYPSRIVWAVWQPHTYSRTMIFGDEFATAFSDAHHVIITDVYPARETKPEDFSIRDLIVNFAHPEVNHLDSFNAVVDFLIPRLGDNDIVLVLSAGDANLINIKLLTALKAKEGNNS
jgi:UDP-N-acetylmuramate--alanine ligase